LIGCHALFAQTQRPLQAGATVHLVGGSSFAQIALGAQIDKLGDRSGDQLDGGRTVGLMKHWHHERHQPHWRGLSAG